MFGIGKSTKAFIRKIKYNLQDIFVNSQESSQYYHEMTIKYYNPEYFIDIVPKYKIIFIQVPKAGSTTIKTLLSKAAGAAISNPNDINYRKKSGLLSPRGFGLDNFLNLVRSPEALVFTVVRHPYRRLLSCYQDKFARNAARENTPYNRDARRFIPDEEWLRLEPDEPLPLETFIKMACRSNYSRINGHWSAISDIVPLSLIPVIHIGKIEQMTETINLLRQRGLPESVFDNIQLNKTGGGSMQDALLSEPLRHAINHAYARDFSNFGYDPT